MGYILALAGHLVMVETAHAVGRGRLVAEKLKLLAGSLTQKVHATVQ